MSKMTILILPMLLLLVQINTAMAYVGPGAGISVLGSLLSILATIFVAIGAIIFWPLRKYLKRRKARRETPAGTETAEPGEDRRRGGRGAGFRESISAQIFTDPVIGATLPCEKTVNQAFGRYQDVGLICGGRFNSKDLTCIA